MSCFPLLMAPLVLLNVVGLTSRLLPLAPRLQALAKAGWCVPLQEVIPAVTCTAQAAMLTGKSVEEHGIVGNGWLFRDTGEVRFWQQSNRLLQAEPIYETARRRAAKQGQSFKCAKLFWWLNQGAAVDVSVTPKPYYGADGNKAFGITGSPEGLTRRLEQELGRFPFHTFWGPLAGLPCTQWIGRCAPAILRNERPDLTLVYLPHLDYDPQRFGPDACDWARLVGELDAACEPLLDTARSIGARVWVVSEYSHVEVRRAVLLNRALREAGLLSVRQGPFGEILETFESRAFAVCDHQIAHIYLNDPSARDTVRDLIAGLPGVAGIWQGEERSHGSWQGQPLRLNHSRAGDLVALAEPDAWFAYPFWLDDRQAPDYARTIDIHRKPGYDPCELFFDPKLRWPKVRIALRLMQKKLGFRTLLDVVPLDPALVRGSHGVPALQAQDRPILIGDGSPADKAELPMTAVHELLLQRLKLVEE